MKILIYIWLITLFMDNLLPLLLARFYPNYEHKLRSELRDCETLRKLGIPMLRFLAADTRQERILKEYIDGATVAELLKEGRTEPDRLAQVQVMCDRLYPVGLNIDCYPTNFVPHDGTLCYIDYECNAYRANQPHCLFVCHYASGQPKPYQFPKHRFCLAAFFLLLYYIVWIRYFAGGRDIALLNRPFLFVPMPLAVFPVLYFLSAALWLHNIPAAIIMMIFGASHLTVSVQSFR